MDTRHSQTVFLEPSDVVLLDSAMRTAYTRLIDSGALRSGPGLHGIRDILVLAITSAIGRGERDEWRLARRAIFAACESIRPQTRDD